MRAAAADLEFEEAGRLRDELKRLEALDLGPAGATSGSRVPGKAKRDQDAGAARGGWVGGTIPSKIRRGRGPKQAKAR